MSVVASVLKELHKQKHAKQVELNRLDGAIAIIRMLGGSLAPGRVTSKRTLSAAARGRIIAAQRSRWAKWRAAKKRKAA